MSTFTLNSITVQGLNVISRLIAGSTLEFTRIAVGDGAIPSGKTPLTVTDLSNKLFDVKISTVTSDGKGSATVVGSFDNQSLEVGFFYRELGLFAKDPSTGDEILYCYGNAQADAEWISPAGASSIIEKVVKIVTLCGNAERVTCTVASGLYPTREEMNTALEVKAQLNGGQVVAEQMRFISNQDLYVDGSISDEKAESADGTELKPFKTIQEAVNARYYGARVATIHISASTYNENVSIPRSEGFAWRLERNGDGDVIITSFIADNVGYLRLEGLTFTAPTGSKNDCILIANTANVYIYDCIINGHTNMSAIVFNGSRGRVNNVQFYNCGVAVACVENSNISIVNVSGTGNVRAFHADCSIITYTDVSLQAETMEEMIHNGVINPAPRSEIDRLDILVHENTFRTQALTLAITNELMWLITEVFDSAKDIDKTSQDGQTFINALDLNKHIIVKNSDATWNVQSVPFALDKTYNIAWAIVDYTGTGTVDLSISRDGGTTWTAVPNNSIADLSTQPTGLTYVVGLIINGQVTLNNIAWGLK